MEKHLLMAPGPVPISPEVKKILSEDVIHHRSPLFQECLKRVYQNLPSIFETDGKVLLSTSSGTGAMEMAMLNFVTKGDKVIVVNSGKFGERWLEMAKRIGCDTIEIKTPWGKSVEAENYTKLLKENPDTKAIFSQFCETSTGAMHPIYEMAKIKNDIAPNCLFMVDTITAVLTTELKMKEWGIDLCTAGSQKAFMLPPGLSMVALSKKAEKAILDKTTSVYFDLKKELKAFEKNQTAFSSNVPLIRALDLVLNDIDKKGKQVFIEEVQKRALATRKAIEMIGLKLYPENSAPALSVIEVPESVDGQKLREHIETKYHITFMGGQDQLAGKIIRIGHMGYITHDDVLRSIESFALALEDFGYKTKRVAALNEAKEVL